MNPKRHRLGLILSSILLGGAIGLSSCQVDLSWKPLLLEVDDERAVFEAARDVVARYFGGVAVIEEPENGRIETDYIYRYGSQPLLRERAWIHVERSETGTRVEVLVVIEEGRVDVDSAQGVVWEKLGSDVKVEQILLDSITERIGRLGFGRDSKQDSRSNP